MIVGIGVISRDNHPLFIKSWGNDEDPLKFHRIIHRALDFIEERTNNPPPFGSEGTGDTKLSMMYIGLLYPTEDYKTYGYMTQTGTKLVLVLTDTSANDHNINHFFKRFHDIYCRAVCNPFYIPGTVIKARKFEDELDDLVKRCSSK
eukprot:TRINITY_DN3103_c0_g1_i2.p1 TRINITY_DN3103_c0_g1~~TRINITY_DN3103_c0_g1_i2.p1  ORF type:complete len:147 (-),score=39.95 TRINITY_DN3103_c0_g1_i2:201-641(-)